VIYDAAVPPNTIATPILSASGGDLKAAGAPVVRGENGAWTVAAGSYAFYFPASGNQVDRSLNLADWRRRQVRQRLHQISLRLDAVPAASQVFGLD
jgi:hypothetical protein